jgi:hypothetical protein
MLGYELFFYGSGSNRTLEREGLSGHCLDFQSPGTPGQPLSQHCGHETRTIPGWPWAVFKIVILSHTQLTPKVHLQQSPYNFPTN